MTDALLVFGESGAAAGAPQQEPGKKPCKLPCYVSISELLEIYRWEDYAGAGAAVRPIWREAGVTTTVSLLAAWESGSRAWRTLKGRVFAVCFSCLDAAPSIEKR